MKHILFLCTGNSCRSQMAEGWARHFYADDPELRFVSAGTEKHGLNPRAVRVMQEAGVDISHHSSKLLSELPVTDFYAVFTVCDHAREVCPTLPGTKVIHTGFEDPPFLTKDMQDEEEILAVYRKVRDEIRDFVLHIKEYLQR